MPPVLRLPNAVPGHPRLNRNHFKRLKNSINRQARLYANSNSNSNNNNYNVNAVSREQALRRNIAREVGMTQAQIAPYYYKYLNLMEANTARRGSSPNTRRNASVRKAANRFKKLPRMSAMRGQLRSAIVRTGNRNVNIPIEIRNLIAAHMLRQ